MKMRKAMMQSMMFRCRPDDGLLYKIRRREWEDNVYIYSYKLTE